MSPKKYLLVVGGPTASGKTGLAIQLAQHFQTAILSADSRQFFRELSIGTAKPNPEELAAASHYFINNLSITHEYSVGAYEREALQLLDQLYLQHDLVILCGGSGLYIKAVCEGMDHFPEVPLTVRREVEQIFSEEGLAGLQTRLQQVDPDYYEEVDRNNPHRLIRALAVYTASGRPYSSFRTAATQERSFSPIYLQLSWDRAVLYERINRRVDLMMEAGLLEEVRSLLPYREKTPLQTVGYQELFQYFDGELSLPEAVDLIKRNSRRYAKRQLTWLRRDGFWKHFSPDEYPGLPAYLQWYMQQNMEFACIHSENQGQLLQFRQNGTVYASLRLRSYPKYLILDQWESRDALAASWLIHDCIHRAEGLPVWAVLSPGNELFPLEHGFEAKGPVPLPQSLAATIDATEKLIFYRPPSPKP